LLVWVLAIGQGQRFLERPNAWRAVALGVAVGIAQLFKYNGWIAGAIVPISAVAWLVFHPAERKSRTSLAIWGWGLVAAIFAAVVYWPWYQFVESHGGYSALLAHQRGYLGGFSSWPRHFLIQVEQAMALSGGFVWWISGAIAASVAMLFSTSESKPWWRILLTISLETVFLAAMCMKPDSSWLVPLVVLLVLLIGAKETMPHGAYLLLAGAIALSVLTPFYHPYARLWLPLQAIGWIVSGCLSAVMDWNVEGMLRGPFAEWKLRMLSRLYLWDRDEKPRRLDFWRRATRSGWLVRPFGRRSLRK
jgi:hypothetical protein